MQRLQLLLIAILVCVATAKASVDAVFNWSTPATLTPSFTASLNSSNRYGDYVSNVTFSDNGVTLVINDDNVTDASQKARFVYNYLTDCIEIRAYANSDITITAPEGYGVSSVTFEGAKADENYLSSTSQGTFAKGSWTASLSAQAATFHVDATINCTQITVKCTESNGVNDIIADNASSRSVAWFNILGQKLSSQPSRAGVYIYKNGNTAKQILIR
jgi:hypothetical protein